MMLLSQTCTARVGCGIYGLKISRHGVQGNRPLQSKENVLILIWQNLKKHNCSRAYKEISLHLYAEYIAPLNIVVLKIYITPFTLDVQNM